MKRWMYLFIWCSSLVAYAQLDADSLRRIIVNDTLASERANAMHGLAYLFLGNKQYDSASHYFNLSKELAIETRNETLEATNYFGLGKIAYATGSFQVAIDYYQQALAISLDPDVIKRTAAIELENEQANRIQALELQAQEALYLSQINEEKKVRNSVLAGLAVTIVILSVMWISYWQKRKVNKALEEKNKIISEQAVNLKQLNETKDRFFSIISHDLRGPMGVFQGYSFMVKSMLEDKNYEKLENFADEVEKISKRMSELLDNLLNWAIKQQGRFPYHPEELSLKMCMDENLDIFTTMADTKKIKIISEVKQESVVWADRNSLMTIIRNLLNNALKFTQPNGTIRIHCQPENGQIALNFSDTGVGIPSDKLESLFKLKGEKASLGTKGERGVGLGLQLVYDFVKLNNGEIRVASEEEKGTTFTVLLPPVS